VTLEERIAREAARLPVKERAAIEGAAPRLAAFLSLLLERNQAMNLVSARSAEPQVLVQRHLFDSLFGLALLPPAIGRIRLLDVGSGGGFPAIPLLVVREDLEGALVESSGKKAAFLAEVVESLALNARVVTARFPDSFPMEIAGPFDVLTTRAVAGAGKLVRGARRLLAPGARALLWTSERLAPDAARDSRAARTAFHRAPWAETSGVLTLECFT
jgi:16S rRNA (guanine527-N7)-methyltransferase